MCYHVYMKAGRASTNSVGVRELRTHMGDWLHRVRQGQSVEITSHGTPVALLIPPPEQSHPLADLIAEGKVLQAQRGTDSLKAPKQPKRKIDMPISEALQHVREDIVD